MSGFTGELDGAQRLSGTLGAAAEQLGDLTQVNRDQGEETLRAADIPRRTGHLASTAAVDATGAGFALVAAAAYAGYVHGYNPFFTRALDARSGAIVEAHREHVVDVLSTVRGV